MSVLESKLEKDCVRLAEDWGVLALKLRAHGRRGFPDRTLLGRCGVVVFVEFKRPGAKPRPDEKLQEKVHKQLRERGFRVYTVKSERQFESILHRYFNG